MKKALVVSLMIFIVLVFSACNSNLKTEQSKNDNIILQETIMENSPFYLVGEYLVEYDLSSNYPNQYISKTKILPEKSQIQTIESVTPEKISTQVLLWDEVYGRSEKVFLSIQRDGSGYEIET